jgi:hypothetical protein
MIAVLPAQHQHHLDQLAQLAELAELVELVEHQLLLQAVPLLAPALRSALELVTVICLNSDSSVHLLLIASSR